MSETGTIALNATSCRSSNRLLDSFGRTLSLVWFWTVIHHIVCASCVVIECLVRRCKVEALDGGDWTKELSSNRALEVRIHLPCSGRLHLTTCHELTNEPYDLSA